LLTIYLDITILYLHSLPTRRSSDLGSSPANRRRPALSSAGMCSFTGTPAASASSARSSGLRSNVGYDGVHPMREAWARTSAVLRSEEHTSELQSRENLVCRLLLEKK